MSIVAEFHTSAGRFAQLPNIHPAREVAFMGRSNAGKSSAINALLGKKQLARVSKTPGRTQLFNYFRVKTQQGIGYVVDFPGLGYAKLPVSQTAQWEQEIEHYCQKRDSLAGVFLFCDIRHPLQRADCVLMEMIQQAGCPLHILLTKADKLSRNELHLALKRFEPQLMKTLSGMSELTAVSYQAFSALKKDGVEEALLQLSSFMYPEIEAV